MTCKDCNKIEMDNAFLTGQVRGLQERLEREEETNNILKNQIHLWKKIEEKAGGD